MRCIKYGFIFLAVVRRRILLARRMVVVLKLYKLKEVYQESYDLYLEDKVILKELGMIHILIIVIYIISI